MGREQGAGRAKDSTMKNLRKMLKFNETLVVEPRFRRVTFNFRQHRSNRKENEEKTLSNHFRISNRYDDPVLEQG